MKTRILYNILWLGLALTFVAVLLRLFQTSAGAVATQLADAPMRLYLQVGGLAVLVQVVGALKWRASHAALIGDDRQRTLWKLTEITTLGSLGSQFLPAQISHLIVRWFYSAKADGQRYKAASSTIYEQFCDLILFLALSLAFLVGLWLGSPGSLILPLGLVALMVSLPLLDLSIRLIESGIRTLGGVRALTTAMTKAQAVVGQSRRISRWGNTRILLFSGVITVARAAQAFLIIRALAPAADALFAAAAFPVTGLISALPISPAGLGVTELSWSAFLIAAGAAAPVAAVTAVSIRLINLIVLVAIFALSLGIRVVARALYTR